MTDQLNHYLKTWNLSDPQPLAETVSSHLYTVISDGTRVVLKLLTPIGHEERSGAIALRYFDGHGAVRLLREDKDAHLLEYADGEDLVPLVKKGHDQEATTIIAEVLNRLHTPSKKALPTNGLPSLKRWFRDLFKKADEDRKTGMQSIYVRAAVTAEALLADPRDVSVLHGDIHHENIRCHAERGWLAFDPKGLIGERTFDAANTLCNPIDMPELVQNETRLLTNAEILARELDIEFPRILTFLYMYASLSASWILGDGVDPVDTIRIAEIVEPHIRP